MRNLVQQLTMADSSVAASLDIWESSVTGAFEFSCLTVLFKVMSVWVSIVRDLTI